MVMQVIVITATNQLVSKPESQNDLGIGIADSCDSQTLVRTCRIIDRKTKRWKKMKVMRTPPSQKKPWGSVAVAGRGNIHFEPNLER